MRYSKPSEPGGTGAEVTTSRMAVLSLTVVLAIADLRELGFDIT